MKTALITGTTSGFGYAFAHRMAKLGYRLIITGRRTDRLLNLANELTEKYQTEILPLNFDVRDKKACQDAINSIPENFSAIDVLVNNAGLAAGASPFDESLEDDFERMIDTNIKGLLYVSKIISNIMIKRGGGHIINIGSIAGKSVYPGGNVYCATKYAVDALSKGMMMDLFTHNIKVSQICPGAAETEFSQVRFKGDTEKAAAVYKGFTPLSAEDIADVVKYVALAPPHVNISDVVIMPAAQASVSLIHRKTD